MKRRAARTAYGDGSDGARLQEAVMKKRIPCGALSDHGLLGICRDRGRLQGI